MAFALPEKEREYKRYWCSKNKDKVSASNKRYRDSHLDKETERQAIYRKTITTQKRLFNIAKHRAKKKNIIFSINVSDVVIPEKCPLLGIDIVPGDRKFGSSPSLDRIDCSKGYIPGNVWVISLRANRSKSNLSAKELIIMGHRLLERLG